MNLEEGALHSDLQYYVLYSQETSEGVFRRVFGAFEDIGAAGDVADMLAVVEGLTQVTVAGRAINGCRHYVLFSAGPNWSYLAPFSTREEAEAAGMRLQGGKDHVIAAEVPAR